MPREAPTLPDALNNSKCTKKDYCNVAAYIKSIELVLGGTF